MTPRPATAPPLKTLVISDGSLAALLATAMVSEQHACARGASGTDLGGIVMGVTAHLGTPGAFWEHCDRAAGRQADIYGLGYLPPDGATRARIEGAAGLPAGGSESLLLVEAAYVAAWHECERVVWPVQAPAPGGEPDLDAVARAVDRAMLASRLVGLDAERPEWSGRGVREVRIDTPLVDLTDRQLADLALDMRVPVESCWWWGGRSAEAKAMASRWSALLGLGTPEQSGADAPSGGARLAEPKPGVPAERASIRG